MITESEEQELQHLRTLQNDHTRWLSQEEFDRIGELAKKQFENVVSPHKPS